MKLCFASELGYYLKTPLTKVLPVGTVIEMKNGQLGYNLTVTGVYFDFNYSLIRLQVQHSPDDQEEADEVTNLIRTTWEGYNEMKSWAQA